MRKRMLRVLLGIGYVCLLTTLLLYQAGAFGGRREWTVAVLGTLFLGAALAVVLLLYLRVNDQIGEKRTQEGRAGAAERKAAGNTGAAESRKPEEGQSEGGGNPAGKSAVPENRRYEEIYAAFLAAMDGCNISERELEVAWLLYRGYTNRQIGEALYIAETTVKKHVSHIYQKMDVCSRKEFRAKVQTDTVYETPCMK